MRTAGRSAAIEFRFSIVKLVLAIVIFTAFFSVTGIQAHAAGQLDVQNALDKIYKNQSDSMVAVYSNAGKELKDSYLSDILAGKYTPNAVAVFLDHGYFTSSYSQIAGAGVLPEGYELPAQTYCTTRTSEFLRNREAGDAVNSYVLITNSPYLQTEQLAEIAQVHGFTEYDSYESELAGFETSYIPKYIWEK